MSDEKILCVCGSRITLRNKAIHEKTKKHMACVEKQDLIEQQTSFQPAGEKSVKKSFEGIVSVKLDKILKKLEELDAKIEELAYEDDLSDLEEGEEQDERPTIMEQPQMV